MNTTRGRKRGGASLVAFVAVACVGCAAPCALSSDVQLRLDGDPGAMVGVEALVVSITVSQTGLLQASTVPVSGLQPGQALLLRPSPLPSAGDSYQLSIAVSAFGSGGVLVSTGDLVTQTVGAHACNRLELTLVARTMSVDLLGADLAGFDGAMRDLMGADLTQVDLAQAPDLLPCTATTPDEDGDGRGDACDVCAANADPMPTDGDGDGLPDACDPAPATPGNARLYFEPFNFSGGSAEVTGNAAAFMDTSASETNPMVSFASGVEMQTYAMPTAMSGDIDGGVRVWLWENIGATGFQCQAAWQSIGGQTLKITELGVGTTGTALGASGNLAVNQNARIRIWQHGLTIGCEMARPDGTNAITVTRTISAAPALELHPGVGVGFESESNAGSVTAKFSSVFAATYP